MINGSPDFEVSQFGIKAKVYEYLGSMGWVWTMYSLCNFMNCCVIMCNKLCDNVLQIVENICTIGSV